MIQTIEQLERLGFYYLDLVEGKRPGFVLEGSDAVVWDQLLAREIWGWDWHGGLWNEGTTAWDASTWKTVRKLIVRLFQVDMQVARRHLSAEQWAGLGVPAQNMALCVSQMGTCPPVYRLPDGYTGENAHWLRYVQMPWELLEEKDTPWKWSAAALFPIHQEYQRALMTVFGCPKERRVWGRPATLVAQYQLGALLHRVCSFQRR